MLFLIFSNANIKFAQKKFTWKFYTTAEALSTIKRVEIIDKKKFTKPALDENFEVFVIYMTFLSLNLMPIYLA